MAIFSDALQRVKAYRRWLFGPSYYSGFYISNEQLIELGEKLKTYEGNNHPDGVCLMVGKSLRKYSVEMIPYNRRGEDKVFHSNGEIIGYLNLNLASEYFGAQGFWIHTQNAAAGGGGIPQKTPPPISE